MNCFHGGRGPSIFEEMSLSAVLAGILYRESMMKRNWKLGRWITLLPCFSFFSR